MEGVPVCVCERAVVEGGGSVSPLQGHIWGLLPQPRA